MNAPNPQTQPVALRPFLIGPHPFPRAGIAVRSDQLKKKLSVYWVLAHDRRTRMLPGLFLTLAFASAPVVASSGVLTSPTIPPQRVASPWDRGATAASAAVGAGTGALFGFATGTVGHILSQTVVPPLFTIPAASLGAPIGAAVGVIVVGAPMIDSGWGVLAVASTAALSAFVVELVVGIPFVLADGRPFGSYELGVIPLLVAPPIAGALGAAVVAPFFAAPAE